MFDVAETQRRGYSGKSKVFFDGREKLAGKDWQLRKLELWNRAAHRCEKWIVTWPDVRIGLACTIRCHHDGLHPHHVIHRSKERDDRLANLLLLCFECHAKEHEKRNPRWGEASQLRNKRLLGMA
jgi:5-methylcytosine-specific restriction endonuclease McrA